MCHRPDGCSATAAVRCGSSAHLPLMGSCDTRGCFDGNRDAAVRGTPRGNRRSPVRPSYGVVPGNGLPATVDPVIRWSTATAGGGAAVVGAPAGRAVRLGTSCSSRLPRRAAVHCSGHPAVREAQPPSDSGSRRLHSRHQHLSAAGGRAPADAEGVAAAAGEQRRVSACWWAADPGPTSISSGRPSRPWASASCLADGDGCTGWGCRRWPT